MSGLGIRPFDLLFQIIAFGLLVWGLSRVAYKPLMRLLDERAARVRESLDAAERARQDVAQAEQRSLEELQAARVQAQEIVARAREQSEHTIAQSRAAAREEAEKVKAQFEAQMHADQARARDELRHEVADLAILAASRVVRRSLDPEQHRQLIEDTLREAVEGQQGRAAD